MRLLLNLGETGQLTFYKAVATRLIARGHLITFVCDREDPGVAQSIRAAAESVGAQFVDFFAEPITLSRRWLPRLFVNVELANAKAHYRALYTRARQIVAQVSADILLVGEDGIACSTWMVKAAREAGAGVVVIPYGLSPSMWLIEKGIPEKDRRGDLLIVTGRHGETVKRKYPHWVYAAEQGPVIMFPATHIIAREQLGLGLVNPWNIQGGTADAIAVESDYMMRRFIELEALPESKLKSVGSIYCDELHEVIASHSGATKAFKSAGRMTDGMLSVVVSLPPSDHAGWGGQCEFSTYLEMCAELGRRLRGLPNVQVSYSLHPRTLESDRLDLEAAGFRFEDEFVVHLIAKNDLLVSFSSSLNRWALAARKRVVNYDAYRFGIDDIGDEPGHYHTKRLDDAIAKVGAYATTNLYEVEAAAVASRSDYFGTLDGRSAERLAGLLAQYRKGGEADRAPSFIRQRLDC